MRRIFLFNLILSLLFFSCEKEQLEQMDLEQMVEEIKSAQIEGEEQRCAALIYPVQFALPDGSLITVEEEGSLKAILEEWHKNNPDKKEKPSLVYPVEMIFKGKVFSIENEKQMARIKMACGAKKGKDGEAMKKRIFNYFDEIEIPKEKMEATMLGLKKVIDEIKQGGKDYEMSERLYQYLSEEVGLSNEQIRKIQGLAIRIISIKENDLKDEKGTDDESMAKRIYNYFAEIGIPKEKMEATMAGLKKAIGEAKQVGKDYELSEDLKSYFSNRLELTDKQIEKIQSLAIRIASS